MKKDILVIGDAHAKPGVSNERFRWAGKWACEKQPDIIVDMGDWADMPSLSSYDVGKKSYEGRSYKQDVAAALDARAEFNRPISEFNKGLASRHRAKYRPTKIALGGNHCEGRISRVIETDRKLDGLISHHDLGYEQYGWEYIPYRQFVEIQGFTFCHHFPSGVMGRPIGGEMPSLNLLRKQFTSCVAGHLHLFDLSHRTRPNGSRIWGLFAGCYLAEDQYEEYAGPSNKLWWKGLILLRGCEHGEFESIETITVGQLKAKYGGK